MTSTRSRRLQAESHAAQLQATMGPATHAAHRGKKAKKRAATAGGSKENRAQVQNRTGVRMHAQPSQSSVPAQPLQSLRDLPDSLLVCAVASSASLPCTPTRNMCSPPTSKLASRWRAWPTGSSRCPTGNLISTTTSIRLHVRVQPEQELDWPQQDPFWQPGHSYQRPEENIWLENQQHMQPLQEPYWDRGNFPEQSEQTVSIDHPWVHSYQMQQQKKKQQRARHRRGWQKWGRLKGIQSMPELLRGCEVWQLLAATCRLTSLEAAGCFARQQKMHYSAGTQ